MPGMRPHLQVNDTVGDTIPPDTPHAVSVSLPTWRANVAYEEGEAWVVSKMKCGYPRFFIHPSIEHLAQSILCQHGSPSDEKAMLFPSCRSAKRCERFLKQQNPATDVSSIRTLEFVPSYDRPASPVARQVQPHVTAVVYPKGLWPTAKVFWQHTGEGISSRRAEHCQRAFDENSMIERSHAHDTTPRKGKGPKRYQREVSVDLNNGTGANHALATTNGEETAPSVQDSASFVEERFGRNLNVAFAAQAKLAIRRRIAGSLTADMELPDSLEQPTDLTRTRSRDIPSFSVDDVYLFSCGMNSIYTAHRCLQQIHGDRKSVMYGFPYVDTLKVLEKFGPGAVFYGNGSESELDDLEQRLKSGERFLSLFCEFPGNPLLRTPDLLRIRALADKYDFAVVVDETIGNFLNVHILPHADVVVSSLTKVFSGDSNVMGGAMILNPDSKYHAQLTDILATEYEDNQFEEDSVYLERNSRDFVSRIQRINHNAEAIADVLRSNPRVKQVNYPKYSPTRHFYDACRLADGGYGSLLSCTFYTMEDAQVFFDSLDTQKGPSLGTNFTLSSPFVILAHYAELEWAAQFGVEASLVRFSIGLEETEALKRVFEQALAAVEEANESK